MECPSCGNRENIRDKNTKVKCSFCGAEFEQMKILSPQKSQSAESNTGSKEIVHSFAEEFLEVEHLIEERRYSDAKEVLLRINERDRKNWQCLGDLAVIEFWLGRDSFEHLNNVRSLIRDAERHSNFDPSIQDLRRTIAFNIVSIISKKELIGSKIKFAIDAMNISKDICPDHPERDELLDSFSKEKFSNLVKIMLRQAKRDGKSYDPSNHDVRNLFDYFNLITTKDATTMAQQCLAFVKQELIKNPQSGWGKIYHEKIVNYLKERGKNATGSLSFGFFGGVELKS